MVFYHLYPCSFLNSQACRFQRRQSSIFLALRSNKHMQSWGHTNLQFCILTFSVVSSPLGFEMFSGPLPILKFHTCHTLKPRLKIKNHWMVSAEQKKSIKLPTGWISNSHNSKPNHRLKNSRKTSAIMAYHRSFPKTKIEITTFWLNLKTITLSLSVCRH